MHKLDEAYSIDGFLGKNLKIKQLKKGYRAGVDAVLLAACVPAKVEESCLELGSGVGVASLCLAKRVKNIDVTGVELLPEIVALAAENARNNMLDSTVQFIQQDIATTFQEWGYLKPSSMAHVFANPPFFQQDKVMFPEHKYKQCAHIGAEELLEIWVRRAVTLVKSKGSVTFIHLPSALPQLLAAFSGRLGAIQILPFVAYKGENVHKIVIRGIRDSHADLRILSPVVMHQDDGTYMPNIERVLRDGEMLDFSSCKH